MKKSKEILIISYYTNMPGACQAEWVDDRIDAFIQKGYSVSIISASCCFKHQKNGIIKHLRVPTISPHGCSYEYEEIKRRKIFMNRYSLIFIFLKLMNGINFILKKIKFKSGEGRWSWFLSSTIASILFLNSKKYDFIYTTGGPASAHLTGLFLAKLLGKKVICEFQDPLSGKDIGRNLLSQIGLKFFERFIIKFSDCTIYCTENAMIEARVKYIKYTKKIYFVYPGSNIIDTISLYSNKKLAVDINQLPRKINITYLGSLYQTRNLDTLMHAIDELISEGKPITNLLDINLYGNINSDIKNRILNFKHKVIRIHGLVDRDIAMNMANSADVLLLIQNTDDRSIVTIPFKTYDYLHTGKLIFGLIYRNDELENMLFSHGHLVCQANDIKKIKHYILNLTEEISQYTSNIKKSIYTPTLAVEQMINLINAS
jgi:hypothetical protein